MPALKRTIARERANPPDADLRERLSRFGPAITFGYAAEDATLADLGWRSQ
jgi:hypothetical protein